MGTPWSWGTSARPRRTLVLIVVTACLVAGGPTAAYSYDRQQADTLLDGTTIGGIDVGGVTASRALIELRREIEDPLRKPLTVSAEGFEAVVAPWDLGMRVGVSAAVDDVLRRQRDGSVLRRLWRSVVGSPEQDYELAPSLDRRPLDAFVADAAARIDLEPLDATLSSAGGWIRTTPSRTGRRLDQAAARRTLEGAVRTGLDHVTLPVETLEPQVPSSAYDKVVLIRTGENTLHLYEHGAIVRTYRVASGKPGYRTPTGRFEIIRKRKNPTWINPGGDWAARMPARIGPGPDNPLGSRALDLNVGAIRIHGTPDSASIGRDASHGCVRMHMSQAEELFGRVDVGTPVVIVDTRRV